MEQFGTHHHKCIRRLFIAVLPVSVFLGIKLFFLKLYQGTQYQAGFGSRRRRSRLAVKSRFEFLFQRFKYLNAQFYIDHTSVP